jgi:tRNA A-37 threonylcarbamoyl transferase component Bud32
MDSRILGIGSEGIVICPPIGINDEQKVGKISTYNTIIKEYEIIKQLPKEGPYDFSFYDFFEINKNEVSILTSNFDLEETIFQLVIPKIEGKTLQEYFNSDYMFIGNMNDWRIQIKSLLILRENVFEMNKQNIYHNDLLLENLIFTGDEIKIIDFGKATIGNIYINEIEQNNLFDKYSQNKIKELENSDITAIDKLICKYFEGLYDRKEILNMMKHLFTIEEDNFSSRIKNSITVDEDGNIIHIKTNILTPMSQDELDHAVQTLDKKTLLKNVFNFKYIFRVKCFDIEMLKVYIN